MSVQKFGQLATLTALMFLDPSISLDGQSEGELATPASAVEAKSKLHLEAAHSELRVKRLSTALGKRIREMIDYEMSEAAQEDLDEIPDKCFLSVSDELAERLEEFIDALQAVDRKAADQFADEISKPCFEIIEEEDAQREFLFAELLHSFEAITSKEAVLNPDKPLSFRIPAGNGVQEDINIEVLPFDSEAMVQEYYTVELNGTIFRASEVHRMVAQVSHHGVLLRTGQSEVAHLK